MKSASLTIEISKVEADCQALEKEMMNPDAKLVTAHRRTPCELIAKLATDIKK